MEGKEMVQRLGLIGVGKMGQPIAENLLRKGFPLTIFARRDQVKEKMRALGADVATSAAELAKHSNIILLVVTGSRAVRELLFEQNGIVKGACEGTIVVDMTTSDPRFSKGFAKRLHKKGIEYLDAPISGGVLGAQNAQLLIVAGGQKEVYQRCLPVFESISKRSIYIGETGSGHLMKLVHNQLTHATFLANCEAVILGRKLGLSMDSMIEVFNLGTARSYSTEVRFPKFILPRTFNMGSTFSTVYKDISIVRRLGKIAKIKLPINNCIYNYYKYPMDRGESEEDFSRVILKMEDGLTK
jgi:3-hydroxyisobutyrate dehydrogenase-like beta-hydroxyacid dehydrogenase